MPESDDRAKGESPAMEYTEFHGLKTKTTRAGKRRAKIVGEQQAPKPLGPIEGVLGLRLVLERSLNEPVEHPGSSILTLEVLAASGLRAADANGTSDPSVSPSA